MLKTFKVYFLLYLTLTSGQYKVWTPIDAQSIVCKNTGAPGQAIVFINTTDTIPYMHEPHIVTFYRTTMGATEIEFGAIDSINRPVIGMMKQNLIKVPLKPNCGGTSLVPCSGLPGGRRLSDVAAPIKEAGRRLSDVAAPIKEARKAVPQVVDKAEELSDLLEPEEGDALEEDLLEEHEWHVDMDEQEDDERKVLGRALGRGRSRSSSSRSRSSSYSPPRPAPRPSPVYPANSPMSYTTARRRANPLTARRRMPNGVPYPVPTGVRRRVTSPVDQKTYSNPSNPSAGNYGYGSQSQINNNYPSGYSSSSYGYSGPNAHKSSSTAKIAMAAAGGVAVGLGAAYLYSRWNRNGWGWRNARCYREGFTSWEGSCWECQRRWSYGCQRTLAQNANRDDIMASGFIPADFTSPIKLTFYSLKGTEYEESVICPPAGWNATTNTPPWTPPNNDIFVTLTSLSELEETLSDTQASVSAPSQKIVGRFVTIVVIGVGAFLF